MSDQQDILKAIEDDVQALHHPKVRIHLLSAARPPAVCLSEALPDYQMIPARSSNDVAFIRQMTIGSKVEFRLECERVAAAITPLLVGDSYMGCLYDDAAGRTRFNIRLQKTFPNEEFLETDLASEAG